MGTIQTSAALDLVKEDAYDVALNLRALTGAERHLKASIAAALDAGATWVEIADLTGFSVGQAKTRYAPR